MVKYKNRLRTYLGWEVQKEKIIIMMIITFHLEIYRGSPPEVFLGKDVLKICSKFTEEHPCWSVISTKLLCNFIEIALRHECSPVNVLHIFGTPFPKNTSGGLLVNLLAKGWPEHHKSHLCDVIGCSSWV